MDFHVIWFLFGNVISPLRSFRINLLLPTFEKEPELQQRLGQARWCKNEDFRFHPFVPFLFYHPHTTRPDWNHHILYNTKNNSTMTIKYRMTDFSNTKYTYELIYRYLRVPLPFVRIPQPDIIIVPDLWLVIVSGRASIVDGSWVVIPTSIDPDHLSTSLSIRSSNSSSS